MKHSRQRSIMAAAAILGSISATAMGDTFVPNTFADGNDGACDVFNCTLREAVILCTGTSGADVIELSNGVYLLSLAGPSENNALSGDLDINFGQVTIQGVGIGQTIIDANQIDRVFHVGFVGAATLILRDLTLRNGAAPGFEVGGGILTSTNGNVILERVEIINCRAADDGGGLGVFGGSVQVTDSRITNCQVTQSNGNGGGVYVHHSNANTTVFRRTRIANNTAQNTGAGMLMASNVHLIDCMIASNNGPSGYNMALYTGFPVQLVARGSTFTGMNFCALLMNGATQSVVLENCTFSGNGGAAAVVLGAQGGTLSMNHCTVASNSAGGVQRFAGTFNLKNSVIASNGAFNISGIVNSQGYNLIGNTASATITGDTTGNIVNTAALLGPLADNGGPTLTHTPLEGSPAIDAANPGDYLATDQRDVGRPLDGDGNGSALPDIGSVEVVPTPPANPADITGDGIVNVNDLLAVINNWGVCPGKDPCPADIAPPPDGDGVVNVNDLLMVINNWG